MGNDNIRKDGNDVLSKYRLFSAYATEYGTFLGLVWVLVFILYILSFRTLHPLLMLLSCMLFVALPLFGFYLARRFKQQMPSDVPIGYGRAYWFSLSMMLYACLLTGVAELVYFKYMDHGVVFSTFYDLLNAPGTEETYKQMGMNDAWTSLKESLDMVSSLSAVDLCLSLFNQNFLLSLFLAIPTAFFAKRQINKN